MNTNNKSFTEKDLQALSVVRQEYTENEYDELTESLYSYMTSYMNGSNLETTMLLDEIENIIGINTHDEIIRFILLGGER